MAYTEQDLKDLKALVLDSKYQPPLLNHYKKYYLMFLNKTYKGCSCSASVMYHELRAYLINNKL
jgi:hypothetical protein